MIGGVANKKVRIVANPTIPQGAVCTAGILKDNTFQPLKTSAILDDKDLIEFVASTDQYNLQREADMFRRLPPHQCLQKNHGFVLLKNEGYLVNAKSQINLDDGFNRIEKMSFSEKSEVVQDLVTGINYLHSIGLAHGSLRLHNIRFASNDRYNTKVVIDNLSRLGPANDNSPNNPAIQYYLENTRLKMPQTLWNQQVTAETADIYSLGLMIYQIYTGFKVSLHTKIATDIKICDKILLPHETSLVNSLLTSIFSYENYSAKSISRHPIFYEEDIIVNFITDVNLLVNKLETDTFVADAVSCFTDPISNTFYKDMFKKFHYNTRSLKSQVKCFRDVMQHLDEKHRINEIYKQDIRKITIYLMKVWPDLLSKCYVIAYDNRDQFIMQKYS